MHLKLTTKDRVDLLLLVGGWGGREEGQGPWGGVARELTVGVGVGGERSFVPGLLCAGEAVLEVRSKDNWPVPLYHLISECPGGGRGVQLFL